VPPHCDAGQRQVFVYALRFPSYSQTWVAYDIIAYNLSSLRYFRLWLQLYLDPSWFPLVKSLVGFNRRRHGLNLLSGPARHDG
jgi:hypothetical protein